MRIEIEAYIRSVVQVLYLQITSLDTNGLASLAPLPPGLRDIRQEREVSEHAWLL